jgi:hypothetical protein
MTSYQSEKSALVLCQKLRATGWDHWAAAEIVFWQATPKFNLRGPLILDHESADRQTPWSFGIVVRLAGFDGWESKPEQVS